MPAESESKRRVAFVEMLFALTAAQIAIEAADLVKAKLQILAVLPAYTHLLLATALVTTSWVGWLMSAAPGSRRDVEAVFSWAFVVLLLDVFLVVCYFIIVRGFEVERTGDRISGVVPSSTNDVRWLMVVFLGYFLWDFLTKAVIQEPGEKKKFLQRLGSAKFWTRAWASAACLILAILAYSKMKGFTNRGSVIAADVALIALVFLFRALKQARWRWTGKFLALEDASWNPTRWGAFLIVVLVAATVTAVRLER